MQILNIFWRERSINQSTNQSNVYNANIYIWAKGGFFLVKYYTEIMSRFSRVSFDNEKLNGKHREVFALLSFIPYKKDFRFYLGSVAVYSSTSMTGQRPNITVSSSSLKESSIRTRWAIDIEINKAWLTPFNVAWYCLETCLGWQTDCCKFMGWWQEQAHSSPSPSSF